MEQEIKNMFEEQGRKLDAIRDSVERMRKYYYWTMLISIAVIVLPLIGLFFVIPQFLSIYSTIGGAGP